MKVMKKPSFLAVFIACAVVISVFFPYLAFAEEARSIGREEALNIALEYGGAVKRLEESEKNLLKHLNNVRNAASEARGFQTEIDELRVLLGDEFPESLNFNSEESFQMFYSPQQSEVEALLQYNKLKVEKNTLRGMTLQQVDAAMQTMFTLSTQVNQANRQLEWSKKELDALSIQYTRGNISALVLSSAKLDLEVQRIERDKLVVSKDNAELSLKMLLGIDETETVKWVNDYERLLPKATLTFEKAKELALEKRSEVIVAELERDAARQNVLLNQQFYYKKSMRMDAAHKLEQAELRLEAIKNDVHIYLVSAFGALEDKKRVFEREDEKYSDLRAQYKRDQKAFDEGKITELQLQSSELAWQAQYDLVMSTYVAYVLAGEKLVTYCEGEW